MMSPATHHPNLYVVAGAELSRSEIDQMMASLKREFGLTPTLESLYEKIFFLLKDGEEILAMAGIWSVPPFVFEGKTFPVHALVEVIANIKGEGYGKRVVCAIHDYLQAKNLTGFGFCAPKTSEFYKKCGFAVVEGVTDRFIYREKGKDITNQDGQIIFYLDNSDEFIKRVLADPSHDIFISTPELW